MSLAERGSMEDGAAGAGDGSAAPRRRRADAERSRGAVLDAAVRCFAERPDAGLAAVAEAAGVTRQTVYAHFASREALVAAVADRLTAEATGAMDAAGLDQGSAPAALLRLIDIGWRLAAHYPVLSQVTAGELPGDTGRHESVSVRLVRLVRRGQRDGDFDPALDPVWAAAAVIALSHTASTEAAAGRMSSPDARASLSTAVLRVLGAL
ncbi:TetR/AcrR family transcriptional regulator [Streptomyces sp. CA-111067]|uniref:TetR/AcrR family transcriptional regulator n=1 Tax=Streptomyces sp. CA-111067 TaxID=3240046 RepID=UPI003D96C855